jgi:hypothetical protein
MPGIRPTWQVEWRNTTVRSSTPDSPVNEPRSPGGLIVQIIAFLRATVFAPSWNPTLRVVLLAVVAVALVRWGRLPA